MTGERDIYVFKKLKEHLNYIKENHPKYNVIYIALQGSQNYDLDMYTEEYKSDVDTKAIVVPSLEEISLNKQPVSTTLILPDNSHCDVKDIRLMMDNFKKQNINFLEILFTKYRIIPNPNFKDLILDLLCHNEDIAHFNYNQTLRCIAGMSMEKKKALCHPYPSLVDKIKKYGYDGKQLHHIIRMNDFMYAYLDGKSFKDCLTTYKDKDLLIKAKLSQFTLEEALEIAEQYDSDTKLLKDTHILPEDKINTESLDIINKFQFLIIQRAIELELQKPKKYNILDHLEEYNNVFVTSDLHFYHSNILQFEPERLKHLVSLTPEDYVNKQFKLACIDPLKDKTQIINSFIDECMVNYYKEAILEHNEKLIENWNKKVGLNDVVLILGDFSFGNVKQTEDILKKLNGHKVLIVGNHDCFLKTKDFNLDLFDEILDYSEIKYHNTGIVLCHYPILHFKKQDYEEGNVHLFGHVHSAKIKTPDRSYNVGVDVNNYEPITLDYAIQCAKENSILKFNTRYNKLL